MSSVRTYESPSVETLGTEQGPHSAGIVVWTYNPNQLFIYIWFPEQNRQINWVVVYEKSGINNG